MRHLSLLQTPTDLRASVFHHAHALCYVRQAFLTRSLQNKFCREVAILRSCRNSNIVQFQGACVDQGATMLVTEFMEARASERALSLAAVPGHLPSYLLHLSVSACCLRERESSQMRVA